MKNEYTVTYTAEITAVARSKEEYLGRLMSDTFRQDLEESMLNVLPAHQDVHIRDLKVFITKEGIDE